MPVIDTLIFDWDGTLADSVGHIVRAMQAAAEAVGLNVPSAHAVRGIIGLALPEAAEVLFPRDRHLATAVVEAYRDFYLSGEQVPVGLFPGVREALDDWRAQGFQLAVATGKGRKGLARILEQHQMLDYFDATRCADESVSKPDPTMLHQLVGELDTSASRALMVGDSGFDIQMAHNAGMRALAVSYGAQSKEQLLALSPLHCIDEFAELPVWLRTQGVVAAHK
ncbi:haloacid dehalogenase [Halopseudomonas oceani]|uniref:HAD family hydrolase n=1 Tax=Halopseudomonas oceani TaxID=1708783 RepID=A0A2P4EX94_9GAMM|nr:HAD-IA family hydrolase [Halopseudomonas oceani]POB04590.1 HAD family hydrolase [Halopseudomonas oceani]GGE38937.1 haloacid dehalogenase [Halopseudomonas oceani]